MHQSDLIATDIEAYLEQHRTKELLRFLTCGSVDDGKSTLIGRLLHDSKMIYEDQLKAAERDSSGDDVDLSLLVDGLRAEREQGITIDVAYRYFSTAKRKFIIADCPGHEQYTRNMATGASTCDLAIILIDARKGVLPQTRRHSFIVSLLGIQHVIVAVNKMDLVDYSESAYEGICAEYTNFAAKLDLNDVRYVPLSALKGDNVVDLSEAMPWYKGATLMYLLETTHIASDRNLIDFRFPVQYVSRPNLDFRGYAGTVASGTARVGDEVLVLPSQKRSTIAGIHTYDGDIDEAFAPQSVILTLEDEVDISRGDMLCFANNQPTASNELEAMVVWMSEEPLVTGKEYWIKHSTRMVAAEVEQVRYSVNVNSLRQEPSNTLGLNQIGRCRLSTKQPLFFDAYQRNRVTGAFVIVDRLSNNTVGAAMIVDRKAGKKDYWEEDAVETLTQTASPVSLQEREQRYGQKAVTVLLTGLSGSGKTSLAHSLERSLFEQGRVAAVIDGSDLRVGLSKDIGFDATGRSENLRRATEIAKLLNQSGVIAVMSLIAPQHKARALARDYLGAERFLVVHVDCPLEVCKQRDTTGLYDQAEQGLLDDFAGVSAPYETPTEPDLVVTTETVSSEDGAARIVELLRSRQLIR